MPDTEKLIQEWRQQMVRAGLSSPEILNELESHLRDELEDQVSAGATQENAFQIAVERIGRAAVLENEFEKVGETRGSLSHIREGILILAGIQNPQLLNPMNNSATIVEPRWATYTKATAFLLPALFLWAASIVFLVPKLREVCLMAGITSIPPWNFLQGMIVLTNQWMVVSSFLVVSVVLLEWRFQAWPRYRRAVVASATFLLNGAVLIGFVCMVISALVAAPALMHGGQTNQTTQRH